MDYFLVNFSYLCADKNNRLTVYMRKFIYLFCLICLTTSCRESLLDRAEKEAKDYTRKYCPTPVINFSRTDSVVFHRNDSTYIYYCTLTGRMDDQQLINLHQKELSEMLENAVLQSTNLKLYKEAGFYFQYIIHSEKEPNKVLFSKLITNK